MSRFLMLFVLVVVIGSGVGHGIWAGRWKASDAPERAAARLAQVPKTFGSWVGEDQELDARQIHVADITGYLSRQYVDQRTGNVVSLLIVCGRPGPVSVHTPDVCYRGIGYGQSGPKERGKVASMEDAEYFALRLSKQRAAMPQSLRILYTWGVNGKWSAPDNPRMTFFRAPALYKVYVIRELPKPDEPLEGDPTLEFLAALLPRIQKTLFADS
jgi:hypothetical protein